MNEEDKFDELIRSRLSEKEFLFDEENWEKAEAMIDSSKRRRSAIKWSVIFLLGLFSGVVLMLPFVGSKNEASVKEIAEFTSKAKTGSEIAEMSRVENKNIKSEEEGSATLQYGIQNEEKDLSNSSENPKSITDLSHSEIKIENPLQEKALASNVLNKKTNSENKANEIYVNESESIVNQISPPEKQISKKESEEVKAEDQILKNVSSGSNTAEKNIQQNNSLSSTHTFQSDSSSVQSQSIDPTPALDIEVKNDSANSPVIASATLPLEKDSVSSIGRKDSLAVVSQNNSVQVSPAKQSLNSATIFSVDAGANYVMGWSHNDITEARGFNPVFGIGIEHYFNPQWSLYSGIQYGSIAHLKASKKTFSSKTFDFGYNSVDTIIDTKLLYYAVLPIHFHYHFNNKNSIGIGGSVSYLVNTNSNITINTMSGDSVLTTATQKSEMGYYAGAFRQWDVSLGVAYRRRISEKFCITASAHYGLIDIKSNSFFSPGEFDRNMGFKLTLSYNLFDF